MPKKDTKILVIVLLLIDVLVIGAFMFIYFYTKNLISKSVNMSDEIKTELKKDEIRVLMRDDLLKGKVFQDELTGYILPSDSTVDFIKTVEQLVASSSLKVNINSVASEPYNKGDSIGAEYLAIDMDAIGEWKNLQFFIKLLENYPLKIDIENVSFNKISDYILNGKKIPQWSASFKFTVVKLKDTK